VHIALLVGTCLGLALALFAEAASYTLNAEGGFAVGFSEITFESRRDWPPERPDGYIDDDAPEEEVLLQDFWSPREAKAVSHGGIGALVRITQGKLLIRLTSHAPAGATRYMYSYDRGGISYWHDVRSLARWKYQNVVLWLPLWMPLLLFSAYPSAYGVRRVLRWRRTRRRLRDHRCVQCGYNLKGNVSGICPECGNATPVRVCAASKAPPRIQ
jgi:hypothetical protein